MSINRLATGTHTFKTADKNLIFEYVVHQPTSHGNPPAGLIVVQCPGWGLGSQYLQHGLSDLWNPPKTETNDKPSVYTVIFFHPRGTGNSTRPEDANQMRSMPDMASDLEDLREHLCLDRFDVLLGHSNGGAISLGYAEMYPARVSRLVLLNHQVVGITDRNLAALEETKDDPRYRGAWESMLDRRTDTDEDFTKSVNAMWPVYFSAPERYTDELLNAIGDRKMSVWCYEAQGQCDRSLDDPLQMLHGMKNVRARTIVLFGSDDRICGLSIAERTVQRIPEARLITLDKCGHFPWIEQREETLRCIRRFIEGESD